MILFRRENQTEIACSPFAWTILMSIGILGLVANHSMAEAVPKTTSVAVLADSVFLAEASPLLPLPEPEVPAAAVRQTGPEGRLSQQTQDGTETSQGDIRQASPSQPSGTISSGQGEAGAKDKASSLSFWGIIRAGGTVGFLIMFLSIVAVALVVEHLLTLRRDLFMPSTVVEEATARLSARDWKGVVDICRENPSVLSEVLTSGISEHEAGWNEMEKVMEETLAEQTARWNRKVEYLSVIGNIAPMLGLLGTVIGMILAFRTVAETQGAARAADLAEAIYLALVTTVEGLIVAIPSLAAYAFFRNRVDELMAEVAATVQKMFAPLKRRRPPVAKSSTVPPPSGASH